MPSRDCSLQKACVWSVAVLEARAGLVGEGTGKAGKQDLDMMDPGLNGYKHKTAKPPQLRKQRSSDNSCNRGQRRSEDSETLPTG